MAIFTRMFRLLKADIHGLMDRIEDQGLLLKQHLRDMEESLLEKEATLRQMKYTRDQARQDFEQAKHDADRLESDLEVAIKNNHDDIARKLIKRLKPLTGIQTERCRQIDRLIHEIEQFKENIEHQRYQYDLLQQKAVEYFFRTKKQNWANRRPHWQSDDHLNEPSAEEIELELLQRKESIKGGAAS